MLGLQQIGVDDPRRPIHRYGHELQERAVSRWADEQQLLFPTVGLFDVPQSVLERVTYVFIIEAVAIRAARDLTASRLG